MNEIGFDRFRIEVIEEYPCEDKYQLRQKEGEYIRQIGTLNKIMAGRVQADYYFDNESQINNNHKKYYDKNKESILKKCKEYRDSHTDERKEYLKKYYQMNKEKILGNVLEKTMCECGCEMNRGHSFRHKKSQKHINLMNSKNPELN
jgi:hypothetical protein